jgi:hypothetical protein
VGRRQAAAGREEEEMKSASISLVSSILLLLAGCVVPQNYHAGLTSVQTLDYSHSNPKLPKYFAPSTFDEAYIEFDAPGKAFDPTQTTAAVTKIQTLNAKNTKQMLLMIFVHGWKNNASEASGNVWGFRRMLNREAEQVHQCRPDVPVRLPTRRLAKEEHSGRMTREAPPVGKLARPDLRKKSR